MEKCADLRCFRVLNVQWFSPSGSVRAGRVPPARSAVRSASTGVKRRFGSTKCGEIRGIMGAKYLLTPTSYHVDNEEFLKNIQKELRMIMEIDR